MSRLLLIDNYDSFTYNLYQYLSELGASVEVRRNDAISLDEIERIHPDGLVLSPGPGRPEDAGVCVAVVQRFAGRTPLLGVCLGHQAIVSAYGAKIVAAPELVHGKTSEVFHNSAGLYRGLPSPFKAVRYHSLVAEPNRVPDDLIVDARTADGVIMGVHHRNLPLYGVQFHPESILTEGGKQLLQNFLDVVAEPGAQPVAAATPIPAGR
ncbi:MAG: aminodeoxychorismate/anthranilate synthase component II [Chloroflexi bacterium]|nr:aminodeoxychorismate/anthranilate synthase component II [Chloroflexota bacterium]